MNIKEIPQTVKSVGSYFVSPDIPVWEKAALVALVLIYILSPVDLIIDVIPVIGRLDDIGMGALALAYCLWRVQNIQEKKQKKSGETAAKEDVIDVEPENPEQEEK